MSKIKLTSYDCAFIDLDLVSGHSPIINRVQEVVPFPAGSSIQIRTLFAGEFRSSETFRVATESIVFKNGEIYELFKSTDEIWLVIPRSESAGFSSRGVYKATVGTAFPQNVIQLSTNSLTLPDGNVFRISAGTSNSFQSITAPFARAGVALTLIVHEESNTISIQQTNFLQLGFYRTAYRNLQKTQGTSLTDESAIQVQPGDTLKFICDGDNWILIGWEGIDFRTITNLLSGYNIVPTDPQDTTSLTPTLDPKGVIKMYKGSLINFDNTGKGKKDTPWDGWALCNGENTTVDMRGRVPLGYDPRQASGYTAQGETGGAATFKMTVDHLAPHTHEIEGGAHSHKYYDTIIAADPSLVVASSLGAFPGETVLLRTTIDSGTAASLGKERDTDTSGHSHTAKSVGEAKDISLLQPYTVLCFVQKIK